MAIHDFTSQRLFVSSDLAEGARLACSAEQANYLINVLRMGTGDAVLVFNGRDGEWRAAIAGVTKRGCVLEVTQLTSAQTSGPDVDYLFAPLKRSRLDYIVQKATEMGVARLRPVMTQHTIAERVNSERMLANVIEAAEQCGVLRVPTVSEPEKLDAILSQWDGERRLIFCDEDAVFSNPLDTLAHVSPGPLAVLVGPEGGFSEDERQLLLAKPFTVALSLGPRIMRADTAAVAALTLVNAMLGDWR